MQKVLQRRCCRSTSSMTCKTVVLMVAPEVHYWKSFWNCFLARQEDQKNRHSLSKYHPQLKSLKSRQLCLSQIAVLGSLALE